jgi:AraC family transcriptional regulator
MRVGVSSASSAALSAAVSGFRISDVQYASQFTTPRHEHEHDCATIALGGTLVKALHGHEHELELGTVAITPRATPHTDKFGIGGGRVVVVEVLGGEGGPRLRSTRTPEWLRVDWLGYRLASELRMADDAAPLALHSAVLELFAVLSRAQTRRLPRAPRWLDDVTEYVHAHMFEHIALDELAAVAGVHRTHLARTFRAQHGLSVGAYQRRLRIEWAAEALLREDASLAQIAARSGFADQSHFTRTFVRRFGLPPGRWRSERRTQLS